MSLPLGAASVEGEILGSKLHMPKYVTHQSNASSYSWSWIFPCQWRGCFVTRKLPCSPPIARDPTIITVRGWDSDTNGTRIGLL